MAALETPCCLCLVWALSLCLRGTQATTILILGIRSALFVSSSSSFVERHRQTPKSATIHEFSFLLGVYQATLKCQLCVVDKGQDLLPAERENDGGRERASRDASWNRQKLCLVTERPDSKIGWTGRTGRTGQTVRVWEDRSQSTRLGYTRLE